MDFIVIEKIFNKKKEKKKDLKILQKKYKHKMNIKNIIQLIQDDNYELFFLSS